MKSIGRAPPRGSGSVDKAPDSQWTNASSNPRGAHFRYYSLTQNFAKQNLILYFVFIIMNNVNFALINYFVNRVSGCNIVQYIEDRESKSKVS